MRKLEQSYQKFTMCEPHKYNRHELHKTRATHFKSIYCMAKHMHRRRGVGAEGAHVGAESNIFGSMHVLAFCMHEAVLNSTCMVYMKVGHASVQLVFA